MILRKILHKTGIIIHIISIRIMISCETIFFLPTIKNQLQANKFFSKRPLISKFTRNFPITLLKVMQAAILILTEILLKNGSIRGSDCQAGKPSRVQRVKSFAEAASAELLSIRLLAEFAEDALPRTERDRERSSRRRFTWLLLIYYESPVSRKTTQRREKFPGGSIPRCQSESARNHCLKHTLVTLLHTQCAT